MPSGNGARAQQKRERNQAKAASQTSGKSQLDANQKALNTVCQICRQPFLCTSKRGDLVAHFESKHGKGFTFEKAFPNAPAA